jgi:4-aminobutyrate aminotransferase-like enzyme/Ser/Thr protein kinase RdoA (MazF antagonist)
MSRDLQPSFSCPSAEAIALEHFGLRASADTLPSDRDQNFRLTLDDGSSCVLKIANAGTPADRVAFENQVTTIAARAIAPVAVPEPLQSLTGDLVVAIHDASSDRSFHARLVQWVGGKPLGLFRPHTTRLFHEIGSVLGSLSDALRPVEETATLPSFDWNLLDALDVIEAHQDFLLDDDRRELVDGHVARFISRTRLALADLPHQLVYNDGNDYNLLCSVGGEAQPTITGIIDFGDVATSYRIADVAITSAYGMLDKPDPVAAAASVLAGFHTTCPVTEPEVDALFDLICMRLCVSVAISRCTLRAACGFEPWPRSIAVQSWLQSNSDELGPVCDVDLRADPITVFDLTPGSTDPICLQPEPIATPMLFERLESEQTVAAIGRYDEPRLIYSGDEFAVDTWSGSKQRTVHLGIDVFRPAGSPLYAPLDGRVFSMGNDGFEGGYGVVIILEHEPAPGLVFHTLYGHLSLADLDRLAPGQELKRGDVVGHMGEPAENGGWTPHVHFQLITNMLDWQSSFPGVAIADHRDVWTSLCPDPNLILEIPEELLSFDQRSGSEIRKAREGVIGSALSLSYDEPVQVVRGIGSRLFDEKGRGYLDCVNNVCHVGHGQVDVVRAAADQMRVLNTNTRYLHEHIVEYAERLTSKLPSRLDTCFLVNSGSEANDLAIRLARRYTGRDGIVVLGGGYHGNLSSLIRVSPYKFDGPGGDGKPDDVFVIPTPDTYRGRHQGPDAVLRYLEEARSVFDEADQRGGTGTFLFESILSCAGQIDPPSGFLKEACGVARAAGLLCVADEVQTGFGRVGDGFWAFEHHDLEPDIVTLGKPIGNGHPIGAVVTTRAIAEAFDNGMEYFNTFGGNPVSCAIGLAVLDVIERDGLQRHAHAVGERLKSELIRLSRSHSLIGDVRGRGLFLGLELVTDRETLEPATVQAHYLVNRARELGVLLSTDGPDHNVIKIKPPLVFSMTDADRLVVTLDRILAEDPCLP